MIIKKLPYILLFGVMAMMGACDLFDTEPDEISFRIYKDTPVWPLAKAVRDNDAAQIRRLVSEGSMDVNYREPIFGNTVLMTAVRNGKFSDGRYRFSVSRGTIDALLDVGADPNLYDNTDTEVAPHAPGKNAVLHAAEYHNTEALSLLLQHGGDPNVVANADGDRWPGQVSPLIITFSHHGDLSARMTTLKILVEAGADVNKTTSTYPGGALEASLNSNSLEEFLYLLQSGADYHVPFKVLDKDGKLVQANIITALKSIFVKKGSEDYQYKRMIVEYLKACGLDYDAEPRPQYMIDRFKYEYPESWPQYMEE